MRVTVAVVGGACEQVEINAGDTVRDALAKAGVDVGQSKTLHLNQRQVTLDTAVTEPNSFIQLIPSVEGNQS